jgi:hypothetical protein
MEVAHVQFYGKFHLTSANFVKSCCFWMFDESGPFPQLRALKNVFPAWFCLSALLFDSEDGGRKFLRNVCKLLLTTLLTFTDKLQTRQEIFNASLYFNIQDTSDFKFSVPKEWYMYPLSW